MEVAIARVEHIGNRQAMGLAELINGGQHLGQGTAGHHPILEVIAGIKPAKG